MNYDSKIPITQWAEEDRPREKMLLKGKQALSDAELLAILIGSGSREHSAVELCKILLQRVNNNLNDLARCSLDDLQKLKGIGDAKAITIAAALELGRRRKPENMDEKPMITSSKDAAQILQPILADETIEQFYLLHLNRANRVLKTECISSGGTSGTVADAKIIFKKALESGATNLILCHNHPSGNLKPSDADIQLTKKLASAGKLLDVEILDHLIVANTGWYSFRDEGMI
jgi:DNA repair protein RadC